MLDCVYNVLYCGEPSRTRQSQNCENGSDFLYTQNRTETATKTVVLSQMTILR